MSTSSSHERCLSIRGLNHVSRTCTDVIKSAKFYREILGFLDIRRPRFEFEGAWLFHPNSSVGVHLIKGCPVVRSSCIDPMADHLSFLSEDLLEVEELLKQRGIVYIKQCVIEEDGVRVSQVFFHDPENNMIEICNCDELPVIMLEDDPMEMPDEPSCATCGPALQGSFMVHSRSGLMLDSLATMTPQGDAASAVSTSSEDMSEEMASLALFSSTLELPSHVVAEEERHPAFVPLGVMV